MGIRDKPIAPASPWQNGVVERLIGSIRRECVDHIIVLGEAHLRRILGSYAEYYNHVRTYGSFNKDAPVFRPVQRTGSIKPFPILGGFTTITSAFRFSVHTALRGRRSSAFCEKFSGQDDIWRPSRLNCRWARRRDRSVVVRLAFLKNEIQ